MRYGAPAFLNARPLVEGLSPLVLDTPARLVERFERGELDVALLPVVAGETAGLARVGDLGVAADGPVESVLLFLRRLPGEVRTIRMDPASRTSRVLAAILLREVYGARPSEAATGADAELVIGDAALVRARGMERRLDLAAVWKGWTDLPFVFAAWYGSASAAPALEEAHARGLARIPEYACSTGTELPPDDLERYLRERIRYRLGAREDEGLRRFLETGRRLGLL